MGFFKTKIFYIAMVLPGILVIGTVALFNFDVLLRAIHSYQNGTLTMEKVRLDLAAFDLGQPVPAIPADAIKSPKDGMLQVFVPAGEFIMGKGKGGSSPQHVVYLDAYWMDRVEVTNSMYKLCVSAEGCSLPANDNTVYFQWSYRDHPVTYITWFQADEYCQWAGRRLPAEAEWEKAARGTDERKYPWGNVRPNARLANFDETLIHESLPAFRYPLGASPYGVLNMSGNVREWIADWYDPNYYYVSPYANPKGPDTGTERSLRSASYNEDYREIAVYRRYRHEPQSAGLSRGFRCAQSTQP